MADDIDIEEHDVLDNPRLKNIFPNITSIMSAVDYDEEEDSINCEENFNNTSHQEIKVEPIEYSNKEIFHTHKNVIIFGSKPSTPQPSSTRSLDEAHQEYSMAIDSDDEPEILPCSIVLEDMQVYLSNNPCYCFICRILFPTVNQYDFHCTNSHSFLVAVSNNKALKSTSKTCTIDYNPVKEEIDKVNLLCKHCDEYYPDEIALIKHKYSLIPQTYGFNKENAEDKSLESNQIVQPDEELYLICTICSCFFKKDLNYRMHINICHGNPKMDRVEAPYDGKCKHCTKTLLLPKSYNCHVRVLHEDIFYKKSEGKKESEGMFRCHLCNMTFSSVRTERAHRATKHKRYVKITKPLKPIKKVDKGLTSKLNVLKANILKSNTLKTYLPKAGKNVQVQALIQKSHLFKCNKCQIYFASSFGAIEHSRHCVLRKGEWKCQTCRHPFKLSERPVHIKQHALNVGGRFKTVVITDQVLPLLLNRCTMCNICFEPRFFKLQHASGCRQCKYVECGTCNLLIHTPSFTEHLKHHRELNLTIKDFIITDYFAITKTGKRVEPTSSLALKPFKFDMSKSPEILLHCPNCSCNMRKRRKLGGHTTGKCRKLPTNKMCTFCGLLFTPKGLACHMKKHHNKAHKVTDFVLINIINGEKIAPPLPEFPSCSTCLVHFFSETELNCHDCETVKRKYCKLCNNKFSCLALKIHLTFHQYLSTDKLTTSVATKRPAAVRGTKTATVAGAKKITEPNKPIFDLIMKYESLVSIWNILYRCQVCDVFLDSYDSVVDHCQNHFCNMENYNVDISYCKKCKLKFIDKSYDRHQQLHLENDINVKTFTTIDFDYYKLLSSDWFNLFEQLSKDQMQLILSKSIYNEIREVRMHLLSDGSLGSIYKCRLCNHAVDPQHVVEHVKSAGVCKTAELKHSCAACDVAFFDKKSPIAHEITHQSSDESYRIIAFNEAGDEFINDALMTNTKTNELKFVRCQYCAKLINKILYKSHMSLHEQSVGKANGLSGVFHYYVCSKCEVAVSHTSVTKHVCSNERHKRRCPKCLLCIRTTSMKRHNAMHSMHPNMSPVNIKITYINDTKRKSVAKANVPVQIMAPTKKIRFYQCAYCQTCLLTNINSHNCMPDRKHSKCQECGIKVYAPLLAAHKDMHKKIKFNWKNVTLVQFAKTQAERIGKLFRCTDCNLHFIKHKSIVTHLAQACPYRKFVFCEKCNVPFSPITYTRHLKLHNAYKSFEVIDCYRKDDESKQLQCDVSNSSAGAQSSNTNQTTSTSNDVSDRMRESSTVTDLMTQTMVTPEIVTNESRIYKCSECDVHFLSAESCYDHTNNHTPLDPTEYIACKICDLQFLCEFLGKHMKNHREKLFDMDKLVVDEYHPDGRIETYSASDRLKWKLVSTTTHSDSE